MREDNVKLSIMPEICGNFDRGEHCQNKGLWARKKSEYSYLDNGRTLPEWASHSGVSKMGRIWYLGRMGIPEYPDYA